MKVPMSWLKEYTDIPFTPQEYADAMTMSGTKVEGIENLGEAISGVVVGKINTIASHPDADKLVVCQVDVGDEQVQIVTGADNISEGDYIPVALNGAKLPGGFKIKKTKLRGVPSNGMMCSIQELGLSKDDYPDADENGIYILGKPYPLGTDAKEILGLDENIVEFEITSNRPDCLSVLGLARETAVTLNNELKIPEVEVKEIGEDANTYAQVKVEAPDFCPRYAARIIKNVKIAPSPAWMQKKLRACGVRAINNIVDITNYVMLEYGQPMHAFDLDKLAGKQIVVRRAAKGEKMATLDEQQRTLDSNMLVIADAKEPIAVAGVMGGANSEVDESTTTILFESANFNGSAVRLTAKKLGMRTEASARFEKGLDIENVVKALNRACQLIADLGAGEVVSGVIDANHSTGGARKLPLDVEKINRFLGTDIDKAYMVDVLKKLDFDVHIDSMQVTVPSFRQDVEAEADLAEEIARIYGYDNITPTLLAGEATQGGRNAKQTMEDRIKDCLIGQGLSEIMTYSFTSPNMLKQLNIPQQSPLTNVVTISNPLGEENSIMRTTTMGGMLEVIARNVNRRIDQASLFEIGSIYIPKALPIKELPKEKQIISLGMYGEKVDFYDLKGAIEELLYIMGIEKYEVLPCKDNPSFHPGRTANIYIKDKEVGVFGEVHPTVAENYEIDVRVYVGLLDFESVLGHANLVRTYKPLPKYPAVTRDIAMLVRDEILVKQIEDIIKKCAGNLLEEVHLFDVYKGKQIPEGMKSVAYALTFRAQDRTLTDEDIQSVFDKTVKALKEGLSAQLRE